MADTYGRDYSKYDEMSTRDLELIVEADSHRTYDDPLEAEKILYIVNLLMKREDSHFEDVRDDADASWNMFAERYLPEDKANGETYGSKLEKFLNQIDKNKKLDEKFNEFTHDAPKPARHMGRVGRTILVAAIIAAILFAFATTAGAAGFNIFDVIVNWTDETFGFGPANDSDSADIDPEQYGDKAGFPEELSFLVTELEAYDATDLIPMYIPEGFEVCSTSSYGIEGLYKINVMLQRNDEYVNFEYRVHYSDVLYGQYEKSVGTPEKYEKGDNVFYITKNIERYGAIWMSENIECSISGYYSRDDLIDTIDSIGEAS